MNPAASVTFVFYILSVTFFTERNLARAKIRLDDLADLPPLCVCCGKPATRLRQQEFQCNTALSAVILVTTAMLDALVWTKRGVALALPVCEYHQRRGRRSNRTFFHGLLLTSAFGGAAYLGSQFDDSVGNYLGVAAMFAFIITMLVAMHQVDDGLGVKALKSDSFVLTGVHQKFAEAVELAPSLLPRRASEGFHMPPR